MCKWLLYLLALHCMISCLDAFQWIFYKCNHIDILHQLQNKHATLAKHTFFATQTGWNHLHFITELIQQSGAQKSLQGKAKTINMVFLIRYVIAVTCSKHWMAMLLTTNTKNKLEKCGMVRMSTKGIKSTKSDIKHSIKKQLIRR